jgi:hypothetical protein
MNDWIFDLEPGSLWAALTIVFTAAVPITQVAGYFDRRRLNGVSLWAKTFKFALSLAVHFATFAIIIRWMPPPAQQGVALHIAAWLSSGAGLFELGYISLQAGRGRHSHFNRATRIEAVLAILMGVGAVLVLLPAMVIGILMIGSPFAAWPLAVRIGVAIGCVGGAGLTLLTGMAMGAVQSHSALPQLSIGAVKGPPIGV